MSEEEKQYEVVDVETPSVAVEPEPKKYATLADLTEASQIEEKFFEELGEKGMWIKWNKFITIDRQMSLLAKHNLTGKRGKRDIRGMFLEVAAMALIEPKVTREQARLLAKASGLVISHIVNSVMVLPEEEQLEWEDELGE